MANGGKRPGSGRKGKAEEIQLIEKLGPMAPDAFDAIAKGVKTGDYSYVKLFMEYYAGKPRERVDITSLGEKLQNIQVEIIRNTVDKGSE